MPKGIVVRTRAGNRIYRPVTGKYTADSYIFRKMKAGKSAIFQLATNKRDASSLADRIALYLNQPETTIEMAFSKFYPEKVQQRDHNLSPTVGEVIQVYQETAPHSELTKKECIRSIRRISAFIQGVGNLAVQGRTLEKIEQWRQKADALKIDEITSDKLAAFRNSLINSAGGDRIREGRARTTFNAYRRNAGLLLAKKAREGYGNLFLLPVKNPFREISASKEPNHIYEQLVDPEQIIRAAEAELRDQHPDQFAVVILALFGALSKSEMDKLPWENVDLQQGILRIKTTRFYEPKTKNRIGNIPLPTYAAEALKSYKAFQSGKLVSFHGLRPNDNFVLPGTLPSKKMPKYRANGIFRKLTKWLRNQGIDCPKPIHELRKMAMNRVNDQAGPLVAASFGRNLPEVALRHYIAKSEPIPVNFR